MTKIRKQKILKFFEKIALITILSLSFQSIAQAQSTDTGELSTNNVYVDAGIIPGAQASINYERRIHNGKKLTWYGRLGAGAAAFPFGERGPGGLGAITMLTGKRNSHFELNMGAFVGQDSDFTFAYPLLDVGYRYQQPNKGFIFKAKLGILGVGIGLGYAF